MASPDETATPPRSTRKKAVRFVVVGGICYILESAIILLGPHFGLSDLWTVSIGFWVGLLASFLLQKLVAFEDRRGGIVFAYQAVAYGALILFNYGTTLGAVALVGDRLPLLATRTGCLVVQTVWNFLLYNHVIFRDRTLAEPDPPT